MRNYNVPEMLLVMQRIQINSDNNINQYNE